jgi:choline dehydrogenase-like flavoprotein
MATTTLQKTALAIIFVVILIIIIVTIYTFFCWLADRKLKFVNRECADIIIIGGGTASCVVARRLHEAHPHLQILIMERGADRHADPKVFNVAKALEVAYSPPYSEVLQTKSSHELREAQLTPTVSVATMLGGGSSHSYLLTVKGSPDFYNAEWREQLDLSYKDLNRPGGIFDRIECQIEISEVPVKINALQMIGPAIKKAYHKYDAVEATRVLERTANIAANAGPLRAPDNISDVILRAIKHTRGVKIVDDYNCGVVTGVSKRPQLFVDGVLGIRNSSDIAYLSQSYRLSQQDKLQVSQNIAVEKILMRGHRAAGVQWRDACGQLQTTRLNPGGRVILSAGAIYSPVLLQNSGIAECSGLGNKIGAGLINHYGCTLIFETNCNFNFSSGPLAFVPNDKHRQSNKCDRRDWQMLVGGANLLNPNLLLKVNRDPKCGNYITMLNWLLHPRARGWVKANTSSCNKPTIDLNMYEDGDIEDEKSDIYSIVQGLRWMYAVVLEMRKSDLFGCDDVKLVFPPEEVMLRDDPHELQLWAKVGLSQTDHYCGTNALGRVVDPADFTVYGTKNVHVVDASVFPSISDGNLTYPVLVMAEVAADRISRQC